MKTKFLSFLILAVAMIVTTSAYADNEQKVTPNETFTYSISNDADQGNWTGTDGTDYSYDWKIYRADGVTLADNTDYTATLGATTSNDIIWLKAGTYFIKVQGTDANNCLTAPVTLEITVLDTEFCLGTGADAPNNTTTCSLILSDTNGNESAAPSDHTFTVDISNAINGDYTINYTVSATGDSDYVGSSTVTAASGTASKAITFDQVTGNLLAIFTNTGTTDKTVAVTIDSIEDPNGNTITKACAGGVSYSITVKETPVITF